MSAYREGRRCRQSARRRPPPGPEHTGSVTLNLDQTDSRVPSGMSGSAVVVMDQSAGVTVPNAAITGSGLEGPVTLDQDGTQVQRQVVVGRRGTSRTEITSGLKAGDELVITESLLSSRSGGTP